VDGSKSEDGIFDPLQSMVYIIVSSLKYTLGFEVHSRFDTVFALLLEISVLQIRELSEVTEIFAKNKNAKWNKKNPLENITFNRWVKAEGFLHPNPINLGYRKEKEKDNLSYARHHNLLLIINRS